jgi:hypothetical protein
MLYNVKGGGTRVGATVAPFAKAAIDVTGKPYKL